MQSLHAQSPSPWRSLGRYSQVVFRVAFSPDGKMLATLDMTYHIRLWRVSDWKEERAIIPGGTVLCFAFTSDSRYIVVGGKEMPLTLWDVKSGKLARRFEGVQEFTGTVAISPDGNLLVSGGVTTDTSVWNFHTGKRLLILPDDKYPMKVVFSPDGKTLARCSFNKCIDLWDTTTWKTRLVFREHKDIIEAAAFSPDSRSIVSGSANGDSLVWDAVSGKVMQRLPKHDGHIEAVLYFRKGNVLATVGDQTAHIWDTKSKTLKATLQGGAETLYDIAVSPDQKYIATCGTGPVVDIWQNTF